MLKGPSPHARAFAPDPEARYKLIYLARRNSALTADAFPAAWRDHSHLASTFSASLGKHFHSVHQCVRDRAASLPASFSEGDDGDYDGASILAMKSWADLLAARYHPHALDELLKDEARVFAGPVDDWTMAVEEHVLTPGPTAGTVMLSFLAPAPDIAADDFPMRSRADATVRAAAIQGAARIVWNRVVDPAKAYPFAAIVELWWPDRAVALDRAGDDAVAALLDQREIADTTRGARLFARLNHAKGAAA